MNSWSVEISQILKIKILWKLFLFKNFLPSDWLESQHFRVIKIFLRSKHGKHSISIYWDSKLLAAVACSIELLQIQLDNKYQALNFCPDQPGRNRMYQGYSQQCYSYFIHPSKELCSKIVLGEVGVSLPWWCNALVLLAPDKWGLFKIS